MRISVNWLNEWLGTPAEARDLATRLTMAGLEVEGVEPAAPPLAGIVVGEIVECGKHPNADSLSVCKVQAGGSEPLQIVCGAPNARVGLKAPLATVGTKMPGGMEIKQAKLRGVESHGMLCSARELGLAEDSSGLLELPADCAVGQSITAALDLADTLLEINLTPNRGDCMGVLGVAREAAVLTGTTLGGPALRAVPAQSAERFPVELAPGAGCARFAARVIRGVRPEAQAPMWLRERLRRSGLRSISAVVDVTNYVMLELGQPMHAYDLRELDGGIVVRRARAGETLRLLDGRDVVLDESVLVIADHAKALGLAGVMGGEHTGIGAATTDVLLEVAYLPAAGDRRTRPSLRTRHRRLAALRARRGPDAAGARHRARHRVAAGLRRRHAGADRGHRTARRTAAACGGAVSPGARPSRDRRDDRRTPGSATSCAGSACRWSRVRPSGASRRRRGASTSRSRRT